MVRGIVRLLAVFCAAAAVAAPSATPKAPPFGVRGKIEKITPAPSDPAGKGLLGHVLIAGRKEADTETDRAVAIVTRATRILPAGKGQAAWKDLKVGQRVEVRFRPGPRIMIYPTRAEATELRILK